MPGDKFRTRCRVVDFIQHDEGKDASVWIQLWVGAPWVRWRCLFTREKGSWAAVERQIQQLFERRWRANWRPSTPILEDFCETGYRAEPGRFAMSVDYCVARSTWPPAMVGCQGIEDLYSWDDNDIVATMRHPSWRIFVEDLFADVNSPLFPTLAERVHERMRSSVFSALAARHCTDDAALLSWIHDSNERQANWHLIKTTWLIPEQIL